MRTIMVMLCGALLLASSASSSQAQDDTRLATLRGTLSASAYAAFDAELKRARDRGLPAEPLIAKALEGAAKNVPGDRIVSAVRQLGERLVRADALLRAEAGTGRTIAAADVSAVADALQRSVPESAIRQLVSSAEGRASIALSAHALADLLAHGVPVAVGVEVIAAWRTQGADPQRLDEIPIAVERLVRQGVVPARAGAAVAAGLRLGRTPLGISPGDVTRLIGGGPGTNIQ